MAQNDGVYVFSDSATGRGGLSDVATLAALNGNSGFGGMNNPLWMMFMYPFILPFINGMYGGGFGGYGGNNVLGTGFLSNQLNNNNDKETILNALQYNSDAIAQLANTTNTNIASVKNAMDIANAKLSDLGSQFGLTGMQVINAIQNGDATLGRQLCECCCENRLAIANQTSTLQAQAANNFAATQLQLAQNEAADQLSVCQQTNALSSQNERNTQAIKDAISAQTAFITKEFCDVKERELQAKIDQLTADNALLRSNAAVAAQTGQFAAMLAPINAELASIKAKQPDTITLPNTQYTVVPSYFANGAVDFVSSYWANRLSDFVTNGGGTAARSTSTATTNA